MKNDSFTRKKEETVEKKWYNYEGFVALAAASRIPHDWQRKNSSFDAGLAHEPQVLIQIVSYN
ncbi:hypothetical protein GC093_09480 [Paenibacillus sp. LMG 31456]|uniref:Uncharacterized protein n=1 Tax=Paenibacillus foliorum TaxID=2654974 RepID=A0A972GNC9_9BACL|nr:hypothetical protein [Paenibacillus foliorum]